MTQYTHKENQSVKNYGEIQREFHQLRREDDEFAREYRRTELERYIMDTYAVMLDTQIAPNANIIVYAESDTPPSIGKTDVCQPLSFSDEQIRQFAIEENIPQTSTGNEVMDAFVAGFRLAIKKILQNG